MSATHHTAPASGSSGFSVWALLRIAGIVVGVATMLRLATIGFGVEYNALFQQFLDRLEGILELGFLLDQIEWLVRPLLDGLRNLGLALPGLANHWRPVFTLMWLLVATVKQHTKLSGALSATILVELWVVACVGSTAIATGLMPSNSPAVGLWPLAGYGLFWAGTSFLNRRPLRALATLCSVVGIAYLGAVSTAAIPPALGVDVPNPVLMHLALIIAGLAGFALSQSLGQKTWRAWWGHRGTAIGVDILGTMGMALGVGYVMLA